MKELVFNGAHLKGVLFEGTEDSAESVMAMFPTAQGYQIVQQSTDMPDTTYPVLFVNEPLKGNFQVGKGFWIVVVDNDEKVLIPRQFVERLFNIKEVSSE